MSRQNSQNVLKAFFSLPLPSPLFCLCVVLGIEPRRVLFPPSDISSPRMIVYCSCFNDTEQKGIVRTFVLK